MSDRTSIEVPGLEHVNPIPNASRIGPFLVSGGIFGKDPKTGKVPEGFEAQCAQTFANVRTVLEAGGASPDDVEGWKHAPCYQAESEAAIELPRLAAVALRRLPQCE